MALSFKVLVKASALTGSAATVYTAPALTSASISAASVNNPTGGALTLNIYLGSPAGSTTRVVSKSIPASKAVPVSELIGHHLEPGMILSADGAGMYLNISGSEYVAS
jgi:hypothetical protein